MRRGNLEERTNVVGGCKAKVEEESWSGVKQVKNQVRKINQADWKKPKTGIDRGVWKIRRDEDGQEAVRGRLAVGFDDLKKVKKGRVRRRIFLESVGRRNSRISVKARNKWREPSHGKSERKSGEQDAVCMSQF